jgi:hypothetical protein
MKESRFTEEKIIGIVREGDAGVKVAATVRLLAGYCRQLGGQFSAQINENRAIRRAFATRSLVSSSDSFGIESALCPCAARVSATAPTGRLACRDVKLEGSWCVRKPGYAKYLGNRAESSSAAVMKSFRIFGAV